MVVASVLLPIQLCRKRALLCATNWETQAPLVYRPGLEGGLAGAFFASGLDTPMLISRKLNPLRSNSSSFMTGFLSSEASAIRNLACDGHFFAGISLSNGAAGMVSPFRIANAAGGSGLSALASRTLTCHISVSVSASL